MKPLFILLIAISLISCNDKSSSKQTDASEESSEEKGWLMSMRTLYTNTYNNNGLLDSTFETSYIYGAGILIDSSKTIKTREYNNSNHLVHERTFETGNNKKPKLSDERVIEYDSHNNITSDITYVRGEITFFSKSFYNNENQRTKEVSIMGTYEGLENMKAQKRTYDTTFLIFQYDGNGNVAKTISTNKENTKSTSTYILYEGMKRTFSFALNNNGDTINKASYTTKGDYTITSRRNFEASLISVDWRKNDKLYKSASYSGKPGTYHKTIYKYNDKGDEIESISYTQ